MVKIQTRWLDRERCGGGTCLGVDDGASDELNRRALSQSQSAV